MIKGISKYKFTVVLASFLLLLSCNKNVIFTDSIVMPDKIWALTNVPVFKIPVTDTVHSFNINFTIRTGTSYPFRNLYIFVTTTSPDGKNNTDTLQYYLADDKGKWYGKGFGDIHELSLPYKSNIFFPLKGTYQFKIQHGMRVQDIKGVYDFGLTINRITQ